MEANRILHDIDVKVANDSERTAKSDYEDKLVQEVPENPKRFWNYTHHFSRSSQTVETLTVNGKDVSDDPSKAEI